jgi:ketosteroid isomerase-like protein
MVMKKTRKTVGLIIPGAQVPKKRAVAEAQIGKQIDNFIRAFRSRDVNLMMSLYAQGMITFDIVPPLQDAGANCYRKTWEKTFKRFDGPIDIELRDLNIAASNDMAFSHKLLHLKAAMVNGQTVDFWERMTLCFRKINGEWLITHEHVSVPANLATGKAALELKP